MILSNTRTLTDSSRMDKRRKNRIQGTWAAQSQTKLRKQDEPASTSSKITTTNVQQKDNNQPSEHRYVFEEQVVNTVKRAPEMRVIRDKGIYELSSGSSVEFYPNFLDKEEREWMFEQLVAEIPWDEKKIEIKGTLHVQPRLTAWFGDFPYSYSGLTLQPYQWSPMLNIVKDKIFTQTGLTFNSMLANLYRDNKDSVDWHSDDEPSLGPEPVIASLSLGDTRKFILRKKPPQGNDYSLMQHVTIPLASGSLLIMKGATQQDWQHQIPKEYHHRDPRINLTFRKFCHHNS
ncbi:hypothetical protein QZH41_020527 [Actinostola sp. cb2023]|nr:hypothetical protein QZH41_020527 [Actinostola sp. cb2023]